MLCKNCGVEIQGNPEVCPYCHGKLSDNEPQLAYSTQYDNDVPSDAITQPYNGYPMKWYKFLIYFLLFFSALINVSSGIMAITGMQYPDDMVNLVYYYFPMQKTLDIVFGACAIGIAAYAIFVRFELAKLKKYAPLELLLLYALNLIINLAYLVATIVNVNSNPLAEGVEFTDYSSVIGLIASSAIMIISNKVYFDKRKSLFVN